MSSIIGIFRKNIYNVGSCITGGSILGTHNIRFQLKN